MPRESSADSPPFAPSALKGDHGPLPTRRRRVRVMIRYREGEAVAVRERARVCGLPLARYVREVSLGAVPRERRHRSVDELIRQLARIGNNLNQLAHEAHARDLFPMAARVDLALTELRGAIQQVARDDEREPHR